MIRIEYEENCRGGSVGTEFVSHSVDLGSIPGRDRPELLKHVVTAPLPNAWKRVSVTDP